ncbi:TetR/AcrR family transcriptional regulator [Pseudolysinimonas sp.]|jgi:AcrR family transcriptional regulator|uniref:TetR/AcrR family transcriptional regulator n=1 Tax=Pseudolysinimonas sp. TaxID=2680009 RepID=UPI0037847D94
MPTPDRTSLDEIVDAARDLLEADGAEGLSMRSVADRVGVRAPSLYKRVRSRDDLLRLVAESTVAELAERLDAVATASAGGDPVLRLADLARTLRRFAHERPAGYRLIFAPPSGVALAPESLARATAALFALTAELAGPDDALEAARTVTAWATGFIAMELAGSFQLGGDVERAFEFGVSRIGKALARLAD